jgi:hypothetical protein
MSPPIQDLLSTAASSSLPGNTGVNPQSLTTMGPAPLQPPSPQPQYQPPQRDQMKPQNSFPSTGARKRYDTQRALSGVGQFIKSGTDYIQAKKNRSLQNNIERLLSAQQGVTEAKANLQQNPDDKESQETVRKNTAIINDITTDPKISKQLQKAFDIDLFGTKGGKNKNEQAALAQAMTKWQKDKAEADKNGQAQPLNPIAQRMQNAQPNRQQLNPQSQQMAQLMQAGLIPDANHQSTSTWQNIKTLSEAKTKEDEIAGRDKVAQDLIKARQGGYEKQYLAATARYLSNDKIAEANRQARIKVAQIQASEWDKRIDILRKSSTNNPVLKSLYNDANTLNTEMKTLATENEKNLQELDKKRSGFMGSIFGAKAMNDTDAKMARNRIDINNLRIQSLQGQLNETRQKMSQLNQMGLLAPTPDANTPNDTPENDSSEPITVTDDDMKENN